MVARERSAGCSSGSRRQLDSKGSIATSLEKTRGRRGEVQTAANPAEAYQPPVTNHEGDGGAYMGDGLKETF